jgi:hypothetical protein
LITKKDKNSDSDSCGSEEGDTVGSLVNMTESKKRAKAQLKPADAV